VNVTTVNAERYTARRVVAALFTDPDTLKEGATKMSKERNAQQALKALTAEKHARQVRQEEQFAELLQKLKKDRATKC